MKTLYRAGYLIRVLSWENDGDNYNTKEIKINTDAGRIVRPLLRVVNNELVLTEKMVSQINIKSKTDPTQIHKWSDFLLKYPEAVDFVVS